MKPKRDARLPFLVFATIVSILVPLVSRATAQTTWSEPVPWHLLDQGRSLQFLADSFQDSRTEWEMDSLGLSGVFAAGDDAMMYFRWRYLSFSRAGRYAFSRWPDMAGEGIDSGFPGEELTGGWGRPELGYFGAMQFPVPGRTHYVLTGFLPFAGNELYPFASRSISVQIGLSHVLDLPAGIGFRLQGGLLKNMTSAGDEIAEDAFQSTRFWGLGFGGSPGHELFLRLEYDVMDNDLHKSRMLTASLRLPLGDQQELECGVAREMAAAGDRYFDTRIYVSVNVSLAGGDGAPAGADSGSRPQPGGAPDINDPLQGGRDAE